MLEVNTINLHYGAAQALRGISMKAEPGKVTCVLGRNGVGKTSLLDALMGQHPVSSGSIVWEGNDITALKPAERARRGIAYVPQGRMIFSHMTVQENIETGLVASGERHVPGDLYELFPVLLEMKGRRGGNLSGGQQQQLAIARALATKPKVLLLDEPTEGIQPSIIKDMARTLKKIRDDKGLSIIVSEQVLSFALDIADRVLVIENGEIVQDEPRDVVDAAQISKYLSV